jgi:hypothetical protein
VQTYRDAEIADWIGRLGAAGVEHVMGRFAMSRHRAYKRLRQMTCEGLLERRNILFERPGMYVATTAGLRWRGNQRLRHFTLTPSGFEHAWRVADAVVALENGLPDWRMLSEREFRAQERDADEPAASVRISGAAGRRGMHRPDFALIAPDGRLTAIEVELSVKSAVQLAAICRGWARARHVDHVYYLAAPRPARAVEHAIGATRAADRITVVGLHEQAKVIQALAGDVPDALA